MNRFFISSGLAIILLAGLTWKASGRRVRKCRFKGHRILPGQTFKYLCNACVCEKTGKVDCTHVGCNTIESKCTHDGKTYEKGERFMKDCNLCWCSFLGFVTCTKKICARQEKVRIQFCIFRGNIIPPRKRFKEGCRDCICTLGGIVNCTDERCRKEKNGECYHENMFFKTNETFNFGCQTCKCKEYANLTCKPLPCCDLIQGRKMQTKTTTAQMSIQKVNASKGKGVKYI